MTEDRKNVLWTIGMTIIGLVAFVCLASNANAAPVPPGTNYDASLGVLNWAAPTLNAASLPLQSGELKDCFWTITWTSGGTMLVTARDVLAGAPYVINAPLSFGVGTAVGYCTNVMGVKGTEATWPVTFKAPAVPAAPILTK